MKTLIILLLSLTSLCAYAGNYEVTVWGPSTCQYTMSFCAELQKNGISYSYKDIASMPNFASMFNFITEYKVIAPDVIYYPVVRVIENGVIHGLVRPTINIMLKLTPVINIENTEFNIYPNPAHDIIHVSGTKDEVQIFTVTGAKILSTDKREIHIRSIQSGTYILRAGSHIRKFVKQ